MEKFKKMILCLLGVSLLLLAGTQLFSFLTLDRTAPVITCPGGVMETSTAADEQVLLSEVRAQDDRDGDLSPNIVVERLSAMGADGTRQVTYAVMDLSGNVGRAARTIRYTDYTPPRIHMNAPLRADGRDKMYPSLDALTADSTLDGDLSSKIKYSFLNGAAIAGAGSYPVELRVNDSAGNSTVIPTAFEIFDPREETLSVELTQYIVYLKKGAAFDPASYYKVPAPSANGGPVLSMTWTSNADLSTPGVYQVDYTVKNQASGDYGKSRLIVVVEA